METLTLKAEERKKKGKTARHGGLLPAVSYGKKRESLKLAVDPGDFEKVYLRVGSSAIVDLDIDGKTKKTLIHQVDRHPVSDEIIHVDFYEISMTDKVTATVPLKFTGESPAVLDLNGSLLTAKSELEVECLPLDLPQEIEVDIGVLSDFEKSIHVADIKVSEKIEIKDGQEELVAKVEPPRSEEEIAELDEPVAEAEVPEADHGEEEPEGEGDEKEEAEEGKEEDQEKKEEKTD